MIRLAGVLPVLPTPFSADGAVDEPAFLRLVDFALEAGADGVVFPGMASEVETLSPEERAGLVAALGRKLASLPLANRIPFVVGASDADPARAAARAEEGRAAGAVAAMVMAPNGLGRDVAAQFAFYAAVAAGTRLPIMLQNAPAPMGAGLAPEEVAAVARAVDAVRFVKEETLPCGQHVTRILAAAGDAVDAVYGGAGARYVIDEWARGAAGSMPALEIADIHVRMLAAWKAGDKAAAGRLYRDSLALLVFQMVFRVRATKEVLRRRGLLAATHARAAGPVFDDGDRAEIARLVDEARPLFLMHVPE